MHDLEQKNENREFMTESFGNQKADKSQELNATMTINEKGRDSYEEKIHNMGGQE